MAKVSLPESNKKLTENSARKGAIQKKKETGIQDTEIEQRTGHKNINSLLSYSSEIEIAIVYCILTGTACVVRTGCFICRMRIVCS
jgi:hypothetical protein